MKKEQQIRYRLAEILISAVLCLVMIVMKVILKKEDVIEAIYNYLVTDIVFISKM